MKYNLYHLINESESKLFGGIHRRKKANTSGRLGAPWPESETREGERRERQGRDERDECSSETSEALKRVERARAKMPNRFAKRNQTLFLAARLLTSPSSTPCTALHLHLRACCMIQVSRSYAANELERNRYGGVKRTARCWPFIPFVSSARARTLLNWRLACNWVTG